MSNAMTPHSRMRRASFLAALAAFYCCCYARAFTASTIRGTLASASGRFARNGGSNGDAEDSAKARAMSMLSKSPKRRRGSGSRPHKNGSSKKAGDAKNSVKGSGKQSQHSGGSGKQTRTRHNGKQNGGKQNGGKQNGSKQNGNKQNGNKQKGNKQSGGKKYSSLLPPLERAPTMRSTARSKRAPPKDDLLASGLSSWEDFLGGPAAANARIPKSKRDRDRGSLQSFVSYDEQGLIIPIADDRQIGKVTESEGLPSITDLFPTKSKNGESTTSEKADQKPATSKPYGSTATDLSSKTATAKVSIPPPQVEKEEVQSDDELAEEGEDDEYDDDGAEEIEDLTEDHELPFSAEQTDQIYTDHNKITIRRNNAWKNSRQKPPRKKKKKSNRGRLTRRGMEMLVGGVPINADPPRRHMDLFYQPNPFPWNQAVSVNSREFGPFLHQGSVERLSTADLGSYCEHFISSTSKWNICPDYLKDLAESVEKSKREAAESAHDKPAAVETNSEKSDYETDQITESSVKEAEDESLKTQLGGELVFSIEVSKTELQSSLTSDEDTDFEILKRVLTRGIATAIDCEGFKIQFDQLKLTEMDDGVTNIAGTFSLHSRIPIRSDAQLKVKAQKINSSLAQAMDDGDMQLAMAASARMEEEWPEPIRNRVVDEFLFEDDDDDDDEPVESKDDFQSILDDIAKRNAAKAKGRDEASQDEAESSDDNTDDLYGSFNDGVFWDPSQNPASNSDIGLRLVDAVTERARERHPRVIAIGDVHGCIDELQDLLRACDYRPGDTVLFLGDLVCKGPDSVSVVQMAREIGAIGVRGNHDFEVIRWHQAIKSGVNAPIATSEHYRIASYLRTNDIKWLYSLPWYINSKDLGALFVHAGFVSGVNMKKQNPRLMMNMRSVLPDGTVTSKFFNNWPWARLWDGPHTVLFGHDAGRGLQQYEHAIGLDTGCVYGGRLSACILPERRFISVPARKKYFDYRRRHYQ